jgi:hypothetical protein
MDPIIKTRLILALKQAAGAARSSEAQMEANELVSILELMDDPPQAVADGARAFLVSRASVASESASTTPPHDELRQSVQSSTAQAEANVHAKVNAPSEG